ncbi:hypothetical protein BT69DRAFT_1119202 [Atractiella rhizophila]|nr:hypothetical protein BT69DRAFT_1119202 [Atractiella rhizophila]
MPKDGLTRIPAAFAVISSFALNFVKGFVRVKLATSDCREKNPVLAECLSR